MGPITATNPFFRLPNFTTMNSPYKQARYEEFNLEVQQSYPGTWSPAPTSWATMATTW